MPNEAERDDVVAAPRADGWPAGQASEAELLRPALDALSAYVLVVDEDVRILAYNKRAGRLLEAGSHEVLKKRAGEALHCLHAAESPEGCGGSRFCADCPVRKAVREALKRAATVRWRAGLQLVRDGEVQEFLGLVTATPMDSPEIGRAHV